ncbi:MAG: pilus assembly protein, partial [Comamonas sp.]|nr:pilus assembly protein [Candidatus Comamonas equi]
MMHKALSSPSRGSILVQFALLLMVLVVMLGVVQIGYLYYVKRDLQRMADAAALEAIDA